MCLGVPGLIVEVATENELRMATVAFGGIQKKVCIEYVPDAQPGEWVIVHVGFALSRLDEAEARRVFALLEELGALEDSLEDAEGT